MPATCAADAPHITTADIAANMVEHRLYKFDRRTAKRKKSAIVAAVAFVLIAIAIAAYVVA